MKTKTVNPKPEPNTPPAASCCSEKPKEDAKQAMKVSRCGCAEKEAKIVTEPTCCK